MGQRDAGDRAPHARRSFVHMRGQLCLFLDQKQGKAMHHRRAKRGGDVWLVLSLAVQAQTS